MEKESGLHARECRRYSFGWLRVLLYLLAWNSIGYLFVHSSDQLAVLQGAGDVMVPAYGVMVVTTTLSGALYLMLLLATWMWLKDEDVPFFGFLNRYYWRNVRGYMRWMHKCSEGESAFTSQVVERGKKQEYCNNCKWATGTPVSFGLPLGGWFHRPRLLGMFGSGTCFRMLKVWYSPGDYIAHKVTIGIDNTKVELALHVAYNMMLWAQFANRHDVNPLWDLSMVVGYLCKKAKQGTDLEAAFEETDKSVQEVIDTNCHEFGKRTPLYAHKSGYKIGDMLNNFRTLALHYKILNDSLFECAKSLIDDPNEYLDVKAVPKAADNMRDNLQRTILLVRSALKELADSSRVGKSREGRAIRVKMMEEMIEVLPYNSSWREELEQDLPALKEKLKRANRRRDKKVKKQENKEIPAAQEAVG